MAPRDSQHELPRKRTRRSMLSSDEPDPPTPSRKKEKPETAESPRTKQNVPSTDTDSLNLKEAASGGDNSDEDEDEDAGIETLGEGFYEVEAVRKKRVRKGQVQYFIKWQGWPESANTWEPFDNVKSCADIIEEFEQNAAKQGKRGRGKKRSGAMVSSHKKKKGSSEASQEGMAVKVEEGRVENEKDINVLRLETFDFVKESFKSPENDHVNAGRSADAEKKSGEESSVCSGDMLNFKSESNDEDLLNHATMVEDHEDAAVDATTIIDQNLSLGKIMQNPPASLDNAICPSLQLDGGETNGFNAQIQTKLSDDHLQTSDESLHMDCDSSEQKLAAVSREKKMSNKEKTLTSCSKLNGDLGKTIVTDKCTGAKKRKQGFVRRVRQSLDSKEEVSKALTQENGSDKVADQKEQKHGMHGDRRGEQDGQVAQLSPHPKVPAGTSPTSPQDLQSDMQTGAALIKILKAVNHSESHVNGKQDITVLFKASRADGREVLVDNKYMKENYPVLLIEFYEKHLRYSSATTS